ncbi:MAG: 23S rRNA (guanosine(2251)-2'-O)-methyltransferase RlmB [Deltaproteobacteria bacterium]|nr:MAG: 23S rRNA (guanosine(2251)-2'-O)-methyltransferase RlmB [Deltaproteobacteria bacterium]
MSILVSGKHPVLHLLKAGRRQVRRLYFSRGLEKTEKLIFEWASKKKVSLQASDPKELNKKVGVGVNHQGFVAEAEEYPYVEIHELVDSKRILMLDEVQDPQNVGALCRSAYLFGFDGVILPEHHAAAVGQGVCHASVGAVEYLKICRVTNLSMTIDFLKEKGFWVYGADMEGAKDAAQEGFSDKVVLVLGSEEKGMRRLTREKCDVIIKVSLFEEAQHQGVDSLNASVAGGILMNEVFKRSIKK